MIGIPQKRGVIMKYKVGDLVKYIVTNDYGIILDIEHACYKEETYKVYWFYDSACDWWEGCDLVVISKS